MVQIADSPRKKNLAQAKWLLPETAPDVSAMFESCIGCKWTLHVLAQIRAGVCRPGALERSTEGLTAKVLNERLVKLVNFGIVERVSYPEIPPRVEYRLTPFGKRVVAAETDRLQAMVDAARATQMLRKTKA